MSEHYQVIIVGGRPAGSSLAIWLGRHNIKTLVVDKATFPSLPFVPSSPIFHPGTMSLLDELSIPESDYLHPDGKIEDYILEFLGIFQTVIPVKNANLSRTYSAGIDRNRFDTAIWEHAQKYDSVTSRQGFSVTGIERDLSGRVIGVTGHTGKNTPTETLTADLIVGADGRFSMMARHFGAKVIEEIDQAPTASYHAEWENVDDINAEHPHSVALYNNGRGFAVLMIPIATRKYIVGIYLRNSLLTLGERLEGFYLNSLQSIPEVWRRLANAQQVTKAVGVREIRNGYRQAFGDGWALTGDALHYKDPLDGQGVYDALVEAKHLGEAIRMWTAGEKTWDEVGAYYYSQFMAETHPMYLQTTARVKREILADTPPMLAKTLIRWLLSSPEYQVRFLHYISRVDASLNLMSMGVVLRAVTRGLWADLFRRAKKPTTSKELITQEMPVISG